MKVLKFMLLGMFFACLVVPMLFAKDMHGQKKIKLLNDAATALQSSNPDLAAKLTAYANEEANEKDEGKKEMEGVAEADKKTQQVEHIKLLRDAAEALKATKPKLAARLTKMANRHEKKMMKKDKDEVKEGGKEQASEKTDK